MAPPSNPAPKPQPNPLPHTFSTSVAVAFLIASASASGVADATLEAATTPAASTAATDMFSIRLDIGFLRFFGPRHRFTRIVYRRPPHCAGDMRPKFDASRVRHDQAMSAGFRQLLLTARHPRA